MVLLLSIFCFTALSAGAQSVYKWRDENGKLHFSDSPRHPAAERHEIFENDTLKVQSQPITNFRQVPQSAPTQRSVRPRVITASDYETNFSATQRNREVTVSGRIGNGPDCKKLLLTVYLQDETGRTVRVYGTVSNVGYGRSDLLHVKKQVYYGDVHNDWTVLRLDAECRE